MPKNPNLPKIPKLSKVVAIIQARMTSTRLPGKVLMDIAGKSMLWWVISRLKRAKLVNEIVLAIPDTKENDVLESFAQKNNIRYVRGDEDDVLGRYYKTAKEASADVVVRITADCPLVDPEVLDEVVQSHLKSCADYTSNIVERTFPRGLDVEVFNFSALERAGKLAKSPHQREHVTLYFLENPKLFKSENVAAKAGLRRPELRLTVDTKEDLEVIGKIYEHFGEANFSTLDVLKFLAQNPDLAAMNSKIKQKESVVLRKAQKSDVEFLFNLRNQKYVYENSRVARLVGWQEHVTWSGPVIAGKTNKELFIIEYEQEPAGQLRLDYNKDTAEVSISLLKDFQGKGIATRALMVAIANAKKENKIKVLLAEVNERNTTSQRLFEKAGFKQAGQEGEWLKYELPL